MLGDRLAAYSGSYCFTAMTQNMYNEPKMNIHSSNIAP